MRDDFEQFAAAELPPLLRRAVMLTGDRELARDLVQDVLLKAHRHWDRVRAAERPDAYLRTMLMREFLSWRRRWSVRHVVLGAEAVEGRPVADHADRVVEHDETWARLATLPARQRAVLVLRYYEGLDDPEIAEVLGCTPGTVRGYASRAIAALRLESDARPVHATHHLARKDG